MNIFKERELFESQNKVPNGVFWAIENYNFTKGTDQTTWMLFNNKWQGWLECAQAREIADVTEVVVRYAVEGMYVVRSKSDMTKKPSTWVREWSLWMNCDDEDTARRTFTNGNKIMDTKSWSGFDKLRIVKIIEHKEIIV